MLFCLVKNNQVVAYPYTLDMLRNDHPHTSFPSDPSLELLSLYNMQSVVEHDIPDIDHLTQTLNFSFPQLQQGRWHQTWQISQLDPELASERVREERNRRLQASDWTQGRDIPDSIALLWAQYRMQLRDLPDQPGFPYQVSWPE